MQLVHVVKLSFARNYHVFPEIFNVLLRLEYLIHLLINFLHQVNIFDLAVSVHLCKGSHFFKKFFPLCLETSSQIEHLFNRVHVSFVKIITSLEHICSKLPPFLFDDFIHECFLVLIKLLAFESFFMLV